MGTEYWYWISSTIVELVLFLSAYCLIFFERVTNRNKAKLQQEKNTKDVVKEVENVPSLTNNLQDQGSSTKVQNVYKVDGINRPLNVSIND